MPRLCTTASREHKKIPLYGDLFFFFFFFLLLFFFLMEYSDCQRSTLSPAHALLSTVFLALAIFYEVSAHIPGRGLKTPTKMFYRRDDDNRFRLRATRPDKCT